MFTWWVAAPYKKMTGALDGYRAALREKVLGIAAGEDEPIVGTPIGREALVADLAAELVPYTPEELLELGERELQPGASAEMKKAAREMGLGDDWKAALEKVKTLHVAPGRQPELVRDLAREAEEYLEKHGLVTVPPLAEGDLAHADDVARAPEGEPVLHGGRGDLGLLPDRRHGARGQAHEHARQQHPLRPGHGVPRADPRAPPAGRS